MKIWAPMSLPKITRRAPKFQQTEAFGAEEYGAQLWFSPILSGFVRSFEHDWCRVSTKAKVCANGTESAKVIGTQTPFGG